MKSFFAAVAFLTRVPVGKVAVFDGATVSRSAGWFPLVGILLGITYALIAGVLKGHLPVGLIAVVLIILDALSTGALHFDGLADTADGFGGGATREDVLRIMRDHAIGAYGGIALATCILFKVAAYSAILEQSHWRLALALTPALGRWSILLLTSTLAYARSAPWVADQMGKGAAAWGTATILAALLGAQSVRGWFALAAVVAVSAAFGALCKRKIGGITGDTLGANVQLCECAALIAFLWTNHP